MGHLLKIECLDSRVNMHISSSTRDPFTLPTVQVSNLALTHTKRITVQSIKSVKHNATKSVNRSILRKADI
jgi:hypothetical protein